MAMIRSQLKQWLFPFFYLLFLLALALAGAGMAVFGVVGGGSQADDNGADLLSIDNVAPIDNFTAPQSEQPPVPAGIAPPADDRGVYEGAPISESEDEGLTFDQGSGNSGVSGEDIAPEAEQ